MESALRGSPRHTASITAASDAITGAIACGTGGPSVVLLDLAPAAILSADWCTRLLHSHGFLPIRPSSCPPGRADSVTHRHVALAVTDGVELRPAAEWCKALALASPRSHLVLLPSFRFRRRPAAPSTVRVGPACPAEFTRRARHARNPELARDDELLRGLVEKGEFERADAWLAALRAEATLLGAHCRDDTVCLWTWLRVWQARYEEARRLCRSIREPGVARTLSRLVEWVSCAPGNSLRGITRRAWREAGASALFADLVAIESKIERGFDETARRHLHRLWARPRGGLIESLIVQRLSRALKVEPLCATADPARAARTTAGLFRWGAEAKAMHVMQAIPAVLQLVTDAEHEQAALSGAAAWARRQAGADAIAFVGGDEGRVLTIEGWPGGLSETERMLAVRTHELRVIERGGASLVVAPMRYAGTCVGGLLVLGPAERAESLQEIALTLAAVCAPALRARLDAVESVGQARALLPEILGQSPGAVGMRDAVVRCAATPFPVLIEGESGTGKELVARAVHRLSARRDRRFAAINCAALSDDLVEAELFGHTRGAFTGAVAPRAGLFEEAHGGTLFLDEVGELSPRAQAKLLRVLQEREIRRVGENVPRAIDVRVVAATNRSLAEACVHGAFRNDLLFRLAVVRIRLPPLRGRTEDIALLAQSFWRRMTIELGKRAVMGTDVLARLSTCEWPGNVRELQNIIAGLAMLAPVRGRVTTRHVDHVLADAGAAACRPPISLERARWSCEQQTVSAALARHAGRRTAAARELGLTRQGLTKAIRRLRIRDDAFEGVA